MGVILHEVQLMLPKWDEPEPTNGEGWREKKRC
jgi:hypothetical protein